jgi:hypothetical protein
MKYGVGQWLQIQATGLLPGKMIQQLNGATQRLLGQQSLAGNPRICLMPVVIACSSCKCKEQCMLSVIIGILALYC